MPRNFLIALMLSLPIFAFAGDRKDCDSEVASKLAALDAHLSTFRLVAERVVAKLSPEEADKFQQMASNIRLANEERLQLIESGNKVYREMESLKSMERRGLTLDANQEARLQFLREEESRISLEGDGIVGHWVGLEQLYQKYAMEVFNDDDPRWTEFRKPENVGGLLLKFPPRIPSRRARWTELRMMTVNGNAPFGQSLVDYRVGEDAIIIDSEPAKLVQYSLSMNCGGTKSAETEEFRQKARAVLEISYPK